MERIASRIAFDAKKIAIASAATIFAIAAIWYARRISGFNSLSESDAKWWVRTSELVLLGSTVLLTAGLFGEWSDSESWKRRLLYKVAKASVILGVVGELLGDGGIFEAGDRLQEIEGKNIAAAMTSASTANERAEQLRRQNLELEKQIAPRGLEQANSSAALQKFSGAQALILFVPDFETRRLASMIRVMLQMADWQPRLSRVSDDDADHFFEGIEIEYVWDTSYHSL
jgi:hypothetical protein